MIIFNWLASCANVTKTDKRPKMIKESKRCGSTPAMANLCLIKIFARMLDFILWARLKKPKSKKERKQIKNISFISALLSVFTTKKYAFIQCNFWITFAEIRDFPLFQSLSTLTQSFISLLPKKKWRGREREREKLVGKWYALKKKHRRYWKVILRWNVDRHRHNTFSDDHHHNFCHPHHSYRQHYFERDRVHSNFKLSIFLPVNLDHPFY